MLDEALGYLRCPHCADQRRAGDGALARADGSLRCRAGHSFDVARAGYVSLLPAGPSKNSGDTPAMVRARQEFLTAGYYADLAAAVRAAGAPPARADQGNTPRTQVPRRNRRTRRTGG